MIKYPSQVAWQARKVALGLCVRCGTAKGSASRKRFCDDCRQKVLAYEAERRKQVAESGKCTRCERADPVPGAKVCDPCAEARRVYQAGTYMEPKTRMARLVGGAKARAKKAGLDFEGGLARLVSDPPAVCACCGVRFSFLAGLGKGGRNRSSPSLDRVDNTKGYTVANVRVICVQCNSMKGALLKGDLLRILAYMEQAGV